MELLVYAFIFLNFLMKFISNYLITLIFYP